MVYGSHSCRLAGSAPHAKMENAANRRELHARHKSQLFRNRRRILCSKRELLLFGTKGTVRLYEKRQFFVLRNRPRLLS